MPAIDPAFFGALNRRPWDRPPDRYPDLRSPEGDPDGPEDPRRLCELYFLASWHLAGRPS